VTADPSSPQPQRRLGSSDFIIVDNSDENWKALTYVRQWCDVSRSIDIATGYFDVGALLALDGAWQKVEKLRILIGDETSHRTADLIRRVRQTIDQTAVEQRVHDPFLTGLDAIVQGIVTGQIEIKIYTDEKFHAKTYITHSKLDVVGSAALVGSSNFTYAGLTRNIELNVRVTSGPEVRELQEWFELYWVGATEVKGDFIEVAQNHARDFTPYEIWAKALQLLTENVDPGATEWERRNSKIYPMLSPYQREGYHGLKQRAGQWGGAFLTDGVGLGKTFVGLMLAEYFAVKEQRNVLIMATKTGKDAVWTPEITKYLPHLQGEFTNLFVMAHTDLSKDDAFEVVERLAQRVSVVIIDEAHNFRNRGVEGDDPNYPQSRWRRLEKICRGKIVFNLTATPVNNTLFDFVHQFELFTGIDADAYFSALGVPSVRAYFNRLQSEFLKGFEQGDLKAFSKLIDGDPLFKSLIVQNSRKYAVESAKKAGGKKVLFPKPAIPRAVDFVFDAPLLALLDEIEKAFQRANPLFFLPFYFPLAYSKSPNVDPTKENRQRQVVGLIRSVFLKRFESSIAAFAGSCVDLSRKILQDCLIYSATNKAIDKQARKWHDDHEDLLAQLDAELREGVDVDQIETGDDELAELLDEIPDEKRLSATEYDLDKILQQSLDDLNELGKLLKLSLAVLEGGDAKYEQLLKILTGKGLKKSDTKEVFDPVFAHQKVIVFTEFADTARYLAKRLQENGVKHVDRIDGSRKANRYEMIKRFAPHYNRVSDSDRANLQPLRVLISTDVLSEGVNLQDATEIINYDIHWNPVRLMQRIGRIDRRLNEETEKAIVAEDKKLKATRGMINIRNFLPTKELRRLITLHERVEQRVNLISKTLGIPGGKLLSENDMLDDVKVFNAFLKEYEGEESPLETLRLEYLDLLQTDQDLEDRLTMVPHGAFSCRDAKTTGLFMCTVEPIRVPLADGRAEWTLAGGTPRWEFVHSDRKRSTDIVEIAAAIRCDADERATAIADRSATASTIRSLRETRYMELLKVLQLPLDAPKPATVCWMQVQ
jgi:hypothetical protein